MNKKVKRFIGCLLVAIIVIVNIIKTPAILLPVLGLVGIILLGAVICFLLKLKHKLDQEGKIDYGKIPDWVIVVAVIVVVGLVVMFLKQQQTLTIPTKLILSIVAGIVCCCFVTKKVNKDIKNDDNANE